MALLRLVILTLLALILLASPARAADIDTLSNQTNVFWNNYMKLKITGQTFDNIIQCYKANRATMEIEVYSNSDNPPLCRQVYRSSRWFKKGYNEEWARINAWPDEAQKKVALKAMKSAFYKAQLLYYNNGAFNKTAYNGVTQFLGGTADLTFSDLAKDGVAATAQQKQQARSGINYLDHMNALLAATGNQDSPESLWDEDITAIPAKPDPAQPVLTRPRVYWLSFYMLKPIPVTSSRAVRARALAQQRLAARYLDKAVVQGIIVNYKAPGKPVVATLPQNIRVHSRVYDLCRFGVYVPTQNTFKTSYELTGLFRQSANTLNLFGVPGPSNSTGTVGVGSRLVNMNRLPLAADLANSRRYFKVTGSPALLSDSINPNVAVYPCEAK